MTGRTQSNCPDDVKVPKALFNHVNDLAGAAHSNGARTYLKPRLGPYLN